ncbi:hypothetical protein BC628DRAFT_1319286 [Trametes gibbosa]|nr:hypothetical protein BC628DRAFT_1319286 [Trametes gibbosa]
MIVRPNVGPQFNTRRSQSTPPRHRSNSTNATNAEAVSALPSGAHLLVQALQNHASSKHIPEPLLRASSGKRRLFRLRRPSSSHTDTRKHSEDRGASSPTSPSAPPRPPRNPARVTSRPSTPSGGTETSAAPDDPPPVHTLSDTRGREMHREASGWAFPLTPQRGSQFPLQRKKSKSKRIDTSRVMQDGSATNDLPFSTLDRAILEELRQKIRAREGQFVIRSGRKYHAFSADEVPYPRSYDRQVVDMDVWDSLWQCQMGGSVTMHLFETPPARVLELGCGTGTWILNAAREWKDSHFVGLDVVPLHPDLLQVGSFDLASRITWIQANFLEKLPFPNEEFDYVRLVRVARGVPEDKWDGLLEEITRVMKPGGAFEMWEEDLCFPGSSREPVAINDTPGPRHVDEPPPTPPRTASSHSSEQEGIFASHLYPPPSPHSIAFSFSFDDVSHVKHAMLEDTIRPLRPKPSSTDVSSTSLFARSIEKPPINPHDHALLETIYDEMHAARFINLEPVSLLTNLLPLHLRDVRAPPPIVVHFPPAHSPSGSQTSPSAMIKNVPTLGATLSDSHTHTRALSELPPGAILHSSDLASGTPFVAIDTNRYSGFSPSAFRRALPDNSPSHTGSVSGHSTAEKSARLKALNSRNPLPNKTINFDPRSVNLLLTLRVQEILACAEPMWDWVVDFQEAVLRSSTAMTSRRASDQRFLKPSRRRRHPKEDALMNLTRTQFDGLLRRFELDMNRRMYLSEATEDRLGWAPYSPSTSEERQEFDAMCSAWADYERRTSPGTSTRAHGDSPSSTTSLFRPGGLETEPPHANADLHEHSSLSDGADGSARRTSESAQASPRTAPPSPISSHVGPTDLSEEEEHPPSSRTGRIFVAWKA